VQGAHGSLAGVLDKAQFWQHWVDIPMKAQQLLELN
jgi:hypothetical protein